MTDFEHVLPIDYDLVEIQTDINKNPLIVPSCMGIAVVGNGVAVFSFASTLTPSEEAELSALITRHVPSSQPLEISRLPISSLDGRKVAVHSSAKPESNLATYAMWTGAGDNLADDADIGGGDLLSFHLTPEIAEMTKIIEFNPKHGKVWVHEASLKVENGGVGDCVDGVIMARATPLTTNADVALNLELYDGKWVRYSLGHPTHRFADTSKITLIPRSFSKDGDWDYSVVAGLVPNFAGTGGYKISNEDVQVHRYYNRIPCSGTSSFFAMTSDDTAFLPGGYYIKITVTNASLTSWSLGIIVEVYRERTFNP